MTVLFFIVRSGDSPGFLILPGLTLTDGPDVAFFWYVRQGRQAMPIRKAAIACALAGAVMAGGLEPAAAAPMPTHVAAVKATIPGSVTPVHWRRRGWGFGALAAGAILGSALAGAPAGYYGEPYYDYGYPGPYYGRYYGYRRYYRPYPYHPYAYGYFGGYDPAYW